MLVYSRTAGPRHAHLGPALPAGLNPPLTPAHAAQNALVELGTENNFAVDWTEVVTQLSSPSRLFRYHDHGRNQPGTVATMSRRDGSTIRMQPLDDCATEA